MARERDTVYGPPRLWLTVVSDGKPEAVVEVAGSPFTIGREEDCNLTLHDPKVSRHHAAITPGIGATRKLQDLGSANGTMLNGNALKPSPGFASSGERAAEISGGEILQFGDTIVLAGLIDPRTQSDWPGLGEPGAPATEP